MAPSTMRSWIWPLPVSTVSPDAISAPFVAARAAEAGWPLAGWIITVPATKVTVAASGAGAATLACIIANVARTAQTGARRSLIVSR